MRYLVECEDDLILKNITVNNKVKISTVTDNVGLEAEFESKKRPFGAMEYKCPLCGAMFLDGSNEGPVYCSKCGVRRIV